MSFIKTKTFLKRKQLYLFIFICIDAPSSQVDQKIKKYNVSYWIAQTILAGLGEAKGRSMHCLHSLPSSQDSGQFVLN